MANSSPSQGIYRNTDDMRPLRQLEHIVNDDLSSHGQPQHVSITTSTSTDVHETQKPIRAEEQQKSHADPLKPDKAWSLTEPSHFSQAADAVRSAWYAEDGTLRPTPRSEEPNSTSAEIGMNIKDWVWRLGFVS